MKGQAEMKRQNKIWISLFLVLLITLSSQTSLVQSETLYQYTSAQLYELANNAVNNQRYFDATIYLFAYTQQNPPEYANNSSYKSSIDSSLALYSGEVRRLDSILHIIDNDLKSCGHYPCASGTSGLSSIFVEVAPSSPLQVPPSFALVCTLPNYKGYCRLLSTGQYLFPQMGINDAVSSVQLGNQAKVTLYLHARFDSQLITLTASDPDLGNNAIDNKYVWSRNASAARVELK